MARKKVLDLFCGAGGAAMGYARAGFHVVGVDIAPQPHYPFPFIQADALEAARTSFFIRQFDLIHASPPCQGYSRMNHIHKKTYPLLIEPIRQMFLDRGVNYVIENVEGAPLIDPITLCGTMFDLKVKRHRLFESNLPIPPLVCGSHEGEFYTPTGHGAPNRDKRAANPHLSGKGYTDRCRQAMGIDWMNRDELAEAIPPAYTEWIGKQLLALLSSPHGT